MPPPSDRYQWNGSGPKLDRIQIFRRALTEAGYRKRRSGDAYFSPDLPYAPDVDLARNDILFKHLKNEVLASLWNNLILPKKYARWMARATKHPRDGSGWARGGRGGRGGREGRRRGTNKKTSCANPED